MSISFKIDGRGVVIRGSFVSKDREVIIVSINENI